MSFTCGSSALGGGAGEARTAAPGSSVEEEFNFGSAIDDARASFHRTGLLYEPWYAPTAPFALEEEQQSEKPLFPPQMLAALLAFVWMFGSMQRRPWVHIAAEMQAGKTGVANGIIRIVLQNARQLNILPSRIFILTGMSDDSWKKQTRERVPREVRANVHHSGTLQRVREQLIRLAGEHGLRDIIIFMDESQIAGVGTNRPNKLIYETLRELAPIEEWDERNIRVVTISATDPAKVMCMDASTVPCKTVRLLTTKDYKSVQTLFESGRIRFLETYGDLGSHKSFDELHRAVTSFSQPRYHVLRPPNRKHAEVDAKLREKFPRANIIHWDSETITKEKKRGRDEDSVSTSEELLDINTVHLKRPEVHTFIIVKNMFYASKTLEDRYVGVLWDRLGGKVGGDTARLQSLLGRSCGYGKSSDSIIYTSESTVKNYIEFWSELCKNPDATTVVSRSPADVTRRMPGVVAIAVPDEQNRSRLTTAASVATPFASRAEASSEAVHSTRNVVNEDNYDVEWKEFGTLEDAHQFAPRVGKKLSRDEDGFILSSTTSGNARLTYGDVLAMQGRKKTAGFDVRNLAVGKERTTLYVCYRNTSDITSVVYVVGKIIRKA